MVIADMVPLSLKRCPVIHLVQRISLAVKSCRRVIIGEVRAEVAPRWQECKSHESDDEYQQERFFNPSAHADAAALSIGCGF